VVLKGDGGKVRAQVEDRDGKVKRSWEVKAKEVRSFPGVRVKVKLLRMALSALLTREVEVYYFCMRNPLLIREVGGEAFAEVMPIYL